MASIYTTYSLGITITLNKSLISVFNNFGSGKILKIYNMSCLNNQVAAITNTTVNRFSLNRITGSSGGTSLLYVKHDTQQINIPADISLSTGSAVNVSSVLRNILWSGNYPISGTKSINELETIVPLFKIWDTSYTETNVQPITLRENEGISLNTSIINEAVISTCDLFIEFTME